MRGFLSIMRVRDVNCYPRHDRKVFTDESEEGRSRTWASSQANIEGLDGVAEASQAVLARQVQQTGLSELHMHFFFLLL